MMSPVHQSPNQKSDLHSKLSYIQFLKFLNGQDCYEVSTKRSTSKYKQYRHPRQWVPPPCLTSSVQKNHCKVKNPLCRSYSNPEMSDTLSSVIMEKEKTPGNGRKTSNNTKFRHVDSLEKKLNQLNKEKELLKEAQLMVKLGESLSPSLKSLIKKWRNFMEPSQPNHKLRHSSDPKPSSMHDQASQTLPLDQKKKHFFEKKEGKLQELEKRYSQAKEEEERLELELKKAKNMKGTRRHSVKLKKICGTAYDYKYQALKRKFEDLRKYLRQSDNEKRALCKENEVLHSALKEKSDLALEERVIYLERTLENCDAYIKECEGKLDSAHTLQEENAQLKLLIHELKSRLETPPQNTAFHREEQKEEEEYEIHLEEKWLAMLNHTKEVYEKAVQGYKEELNNARSVNESLENRLKEVMNHYQAKEEQLVADYETMIVEVKKETRLQTEDNEEVRITRLEKILQDKEKEIDTLKTALERDNKDEQIPDITKDLQEHILKRLETFLKEYSHFAPPLHASSASPKEILKQCFQELMKDEAQNDPRALVDLQAKIDGLQEDLREKMTLLSLKNKDLQEAKTNLETMSSRCNYLESKTFQGVEIGHSLEALKELPLLLKETQNKLSVSQSDYQNCLTENKVLQERLRRYAVELEAKQDRITDMEDRIKELSSSARKWEREAGSLAEKVELLQSQVEKKNTILDKNSSQLEDRIREYNSVTYQVERLREDHSREIAALKAHNEESPLQGTLVELQSQNAQLQSQVSVLKVQKSDNEKNYKKQMRALEEQISNLRIRNATLQKNLETIEATYKTMFNLEAGWSHLIDLPHQLDPEMGSRQVPGE